MSLINIPIINYAQNSDEYAGACIVSNIGKCQYYAACSESAARVLPRGIQRKIIYNGIDPSRVAPGIGREKLRAQWELEDKKMPGDL